jgi:hypothetical protein
VTDFPAAEPGPASSDNPQQSQTYVIQTGRSILRIYVGRAGLLARMGHNHVIVSRDIAGSISLSEQRRISAAAFHIPLQHLVIDDAEERKRAGAGYESFPSEQDKSATQKNMLGVYVLDAERYPELSVNIDADSSTVTESLFSVKLLFKDREIPLQVPASISFEGIKLLVDSQFSLDHQDLGLTPFSVMGGMLRVARQIDFELYIESETP